MNTKRPTKPLMGERVYVVLPKDEKDRLFDTAAAARLSVSEIVRRGIALMSQQHAA